MGILNKTVRNAKQWAIAKFRAYETARSHANLSRYQCRNIHSRLEKLPQPALSADEKREISEYWSRFGVRIDDFCWFQWYYGITGIKDPRFIPNDLYFNLVLPHYNRQSFVPAYKDKNQFDLRLPAEHFPKAILKRMNGGFYDAAGTFLTNDVNDRSLAERLLAQKQVIVKNAIDSGCGVAVRKYDILTLEDAYKVLNEWTSQDYIIQEVIQQHPFFAQFNESSVNIIRINSWFRDGEVVISAPVIRFGMPGKYTEVCFINGEEIINLIGVTDDGLLRDTVFQLSGKKEPLAARFGDIPRQVPAWDELTAMVRADAMRLCHFPLIGWDVTVTEDGRPMVIEYNIFLPGTIPSQMANGPIWGDHTEALLSFLKKEQP